MARKPVTMTPRERFRAALQRKPLTGRVPTFELVFFLTMEVFGKLTPGHRNYGQWDQMEEKERQLHRRDIADLYIAIAERYEWSAIYMTAFSSNPAEVMRIVDFIRERAGDRYFILVPGDPTTGIPSGKNMENFCAMLADEPQKIKDAQAQKLARCLEAAQAYQKHGGIDGFAMCSDYCLNHGPFLSPRQFSEFVTPVLAEVCAAYRSMGFFSIKHTDGNIMPILDQLVQAGPDALHSIDPQAGVDIAEVKRLYGDRICLVGNVNCGLMDTGTDEEVAASARYALKHGMPGGGYIFSTSNCVYTGMRLARYELIQKIWREEGNYPG